MLKLTEPQKRALHHLSHYPDEWRNDTPTTQKCLNVLSNKGLVKVAYSTKLGWCEQITDLGAKAIKC